NWSSRVQIVSIVPMPAPNARAITASRSGVKSGKSRWQWLSTSIGFQRLRQRNLPLLTPLSAGNPQSGGQDADLRGAGRLLDREDRPHDRLLLVEIEAVGTGELLADLGPYPRPTIRFTTRSAARGIDGTTCKLLAQQLFERTITLLRVGARQPLGKTV